MRFCVTEIDINGFRMAYVENTIWFGRKSRSHLTSGDFKVLFQQFLSILGDYVTVSGLILAGFMKIQFIHYVQYWIAPENRMTDEYNAGMIWRGVRSNYVIINSF